jgi:hypothetical protein
MMKIFRTPAAARLPCAADAIKPAAVLLIVAFAAALGACGDRTEEAGAPASGPAAEAPQTDTSTSPRVAEAPAGAPPEPEPATAPPEPATAAESPSVAPPVPPPVAQSARAAPGTVLRTEKLYSEPASTSNVTASVAKGTSVDILAKQGGWLRVKAGNATGWIRLLSVRAGVGGLDGAGVGDVVGAATTRSDPTRVVAVAGLRGLNDEDLKQAKFNAEELARMEAGHVSVTQARSFASQSGLAVVKVPDLPKPRAGQSSSTWESN